MSEAREGGVALPVCTGMDAHADVCTGMDVPTDPWTSEDVAFWTGGPHYQPWKDVAALFRSAPPPPRQEPQRAEAGESVLRPDLKAPAKSTHHRDRCEDFTMSQHGELSTGAEASERGRDA